MYHSILSYLTPFEQTLFKGLDQLEIIINYKFNNQLILLEASTHGTFHNPLCSSYEKLEYLGEIKLEQIDFEPTGIRYEQMSVQIKIPRELEDFFEALAGAVFVDSGCSYETIWRVFSPFQS
ncbi:hypothetical protein DAPPUDRAFT_333337 [Daphnia pulex]|uniref:RNase III domain-containing protein n=1 Tax=Daphnia pulex TaxID=6669 RepID=E9HSK2_DAPPU|nr:hypothetical protein DAPPUDRAFT_335709 [Daphnia pulex]EFX65276.1 hypothetical protein DAPPUDRAFT_333337 [Daphnia pulex]|eukprot:EFX63253.1 hypothetical protein DAPPUDRAFT_335709 [Daphnia pulex]